MTEIPNDVRTADQIQSWQARRLSAAEREAADTNAAAAKKRIAEEHHALRLTEADDIDFIATEPQSVVLFVATGVERAIHDFAINPVSTAVV